MPDSSSTTVTDLWVRLRPSDWRAARYSLSDIDDLKFEGGNCVLGSVRCERRLDGEPLHRCPPKGAPHRLNIYIMKQDNEAVFPALLSMLRA